MSNNTPEIFRKYVFDVVETLHYFAMNPDEENRLRVKACEILLRYLPDTTAYLDTIDRLERIEQELGIESVGIDDDDDEDDDSEEDEDE
jgi:hypothetical protein